MFKFFMILISLLMAVFGFIFFATLSFDESFKVVKEKCKYDAMSDKGKEKFNETVRKATNTLFFTFIFGICLFIASLFL